MNDTNETNEVIEMTEPTTKSSCEEIESEPSPNAEETSVPDELSSLQEEITRLRAELDAVRLENEQQKRMAAEVSEFLSLYPESSLSSVPDAVWDEVKGGLPLAAAFALYEKKSEAARLRAEAVNLQNAKRSAGVAGRDAPAEYFSPNEVRAMSPSEVRRHYSKILDSMKSWNR